jgi:zinc transport system substrate-binding protein
MNAAANATVVASIAVALLAAGCGSDATRSGSGETIDVIASFYPLQYAIQRVGGDKVSVANLTPSGAEPHDLELTADDTARLQDADLVVYLSGFAAAVDDALDAVDAGNSFDVSDAARLDRTYTPIEEGEERAGEHGVDPHFWLDPTRLADVGDAIAAKLADIDPSGVDGYTANAHALRADLEALDAEYKTGLARCANTNVVTSHNAFGYLAERYGLTQVGIIGLTPENEPSPQDLADVTKFVQDHDVMTIYYETLVSPAIAETVAAETGAKTEVLDPIEGLSAHSQGSDYLEVMGANLANLRAGQDCT